MTASNAWLDNQHSKGPLYEIREAVLNMRTAGPTLNASPGFIDLERVQVPIAVPKIIYHLPQTVRQASSVLVVHIE